MHFRHLANVLVFPGVITSQNQLRRVTADLEGDSEESKKQRDNKVRGGITYSDTRQNDNCGNSCFRSQPQRTPGGSNTATGGGNDADSDGDGDSDCSCDSCDCDCDCG